MPPTGPQDVMVVTAFFAATAHTAGTEQPMEGTCVMPVNIIRFERLAYLSLAISMVAFVLDNVMGTSEPLSPLAMAFVIVAVTAIGIALISATARLRKNWLRWVYAVLFMVAATADAYVIPTTLAAGGNVWVQALTVGSDILDIACVYLLFSAASRAWFGNAAIAGGSPATA
jgi:hypothetical protein